MTNGLSIRWLSFIAVIISCVVILLGVATRLMDAGLGCPDWPGCYGQLVVPSAAEAKLVSEQPLEPVKAWMEMIHRYAASGLGLIAILLVLGVANGHQPRDRLLLPACLCLLAVCLQGIFGMLTVTLKLWPVIVTLHLLGGIGCLSLFLWLWLRVRLSASGISTTPGGTRRKLPLNPLFIATLVMVLIQIALGGWTSSNYAGLGCSSFPQCHNEWFPAADFSQGFHLSQEIGPDYLHGQLDAAARTAIHLSHRAGAALVGICLLLLCFQQHRANSRCRIWSYVALALYLIQLVVAVQLVILGLPLFFALLHTAIAVSLWSTLLVGGFLGLSRRMVGTSAVRFCSLPKTEEAAYGDRH